MGTDDRPFKQWRPEGLSPALVNQYADEFLAQMNTRYCVVCDGEKLIKYEVGKPPQVRSVSPPVRLRDERDDQAPEENSPIGDPTEPAVVGDPDVAKPRPPVIGGTRGFVQREADKINAEIRRDFGGPRHAELLAAQQALAWSLEPNGLMSPSEMLGIAGEAAADPPPPSPHGFDVPYSNGKPITEHPSANPTPRPSSHAMPPSHRAGRR